MAGMAGLAVSVCAYGSRIFGKECRKNLQGIIAVPIWRHEPFSDTGQHDLNLFRFPFQNLTHQPQAEAFESIQKISSTPGPQLFHKGLPRPRTQRDFELSMNDIDEPGIFDPLLQFGPHSGLTTDNVGRVDDVLEP